MTQTLDEVAVRHVAHLARLTVSEEEVALFAKQLTDILEYVEQLAEVDTSNVPPTAHATGAFNILRDDTPHDSWSSDLALKNAPRSRDGHFEVPKVLEQETP